MSKPLEYYLFDTILQVWEYNELRRINMVQSLPQLPLTDFIEAPLCMNDLYVAARREFGNVSIGDIEKALEPHTPLRRERVAPFCRGHYSFRLVRMGDEFMAILRLGEHPENGIMTILTKDRNPDPLSEFMARYDFAQYEDHIKALVEEISKLPIAAEIERVWLKWCDGNGEISANDIEAELSSLPLAQGLSESQSEMLLPLVKDQIAAWSHRVAIASFQSTTGSVAAFDIVRTPSGRTHLVEWPEEGEGQVLGELDAHDQESAYQTLKATVAQYFNSEGHCRYDLVLLGKQLNRFECYPVEDDLFWRDLLGFPFAFGYEEQPI